MSLCPYCRDFTARSTGEEIMHMEIAHADVNEERLQGNSTVTPLWQHFGVTRARARHLQYTDETVFNIAQAYARGLADELVSPVASDDDKQRRRIIFTKAIQEVLHAETPPTAPEAA
jgi:hypothetical protein